ncbi:hypothetical protein CPB86DRAFT_788939 [Serendipita vermifera]|nr:hypothetical protein CPB86DRAFT_788939 [Serendipita vermifera]
MFQSTSPVCGMAETVMTNTNNDILCNERSSTSLITADVAKLSVLDASISRLDKPAVDTPQDDLYARSFPLLDFSDEQSDEVAAVAPPMQRSEARSGVEVFDDGRDFPFLAAFSPTLPETRDRNLLTSCPMSFTPIDTLSTVADDSFDYLFSPRIKSADDLHMSNIFYILPPPPPSSPTMGNFPASEINWNWLEKKLQ